MKSNRFVCGAWVLGRTRAVRSAECRVQTSSKGLPTGSRMEHPPVDIPHLAHPTIIPGVGVALFFVAFLVRYVLPPELCSVVGGTSKKIHRGTTLAAPPRNGNVLDAGFLLVDYSKTGASSTCQAPTDGTYRAATVSTEKSQRKPARSLSSRPETRGQEARSPQTDRHLRTFCRTYTVMAVSLLTIVFGQRPADRVTSRPVWGTAYSYHWPMGPPGGPSQKALRVAVEHLCVTISFSSYYCYALRTKAHVCK